MKKMTFKEVGMPTIILFAICLIVAAALAFTNLLTADKIAQNIEQSEIEARQTALAGDEYVFIGENNGVAVYAVLVSQNPAGDVSPTDASASDLYRVWVGLAPENAVSESDIFASDLSASDLSASDLSASDIFASDISGSDLSGSDITATDITATDIALSNTDIAEGTKYHIGYVATSASRGYGGDVQIMVGIDLSLNVTGVKIVSQSETPGFGANCEKPEWLAQFEGMSGTLAVEKDGGEVDSITAATITSRAVTSAINKALSEVSAIEGRLKAQ